GRPAPAIAAVQALGTGLVHVVIDETARGAERADDAWRSTPAGRHLAEGRDLSRLPDGYADDVYGAMRARQGEVHELVRAGGSDRRRRPEAAGDDLRRRGGAPHGGGRPAAAHRPARRPGRRTLRPLPQPARRARRGGLRRAAARGRRGPRPARPRYQGGCMSPLLSRSAKGPAPLAERIEALEHAVDLLEGVAPGAAVEE